jgi:polar amino acid transport system substrate-binding protein
MKMIVSIKRFFLFSLFLFPMQVGAQKLFLYAENDHPLQFVDDSGKLTGFTVEIVKEIQKRVGNMDLIQMVPWSRGLYKLDNEKNTLLFSMAKTPDRESKYQWIGPISTMKYGFYVKNDSLIKITNIEDAKKIDSIGVYRNDILDLALTRRGFKNLDRADSNVSSLKKLMIGRVTVYAGAPIAVQKVVDLAGYSIEDVRLVFEFMRTTLYIAASKDTDPSIVANWNKALEEMIKEKVFLNIQKKYNVNLDHSAN